MTRTLTAGAPAPLGVTADAEGVNVAVFSAHATKIEFCLFDATGEREIERITLPERSGDIHHSHIAGVPPGALYGLRAHGSFDPHGGHRFNPAKLLVDPHARALNQRFRLHEMMFGHQLGHPDADLSRDDRDSAGVMPKCVVAPPAQSHEIAPLAHTGAAPLIYELHVRGFTKLHPFLPAAERGTFAGLAHPASIEHLKRIGVTAVEIMPAAAWLDERHLPPLGLTNYWGYNPVAFCAVDPLLAPGGFSEMRAATNALHAAGIAVILDVVLNHSGESDELGPTVSLRGLDNASYYRLRPGDPRYYVNDAGCGNILAFDRAPVIALAMDALRAFALEGGVDGFRFDLATTLARRADGFDPHAPLFAAIAQDPALRHLRMIAEPWDIGPGGYQVGNFPADWQEWNDKFRDDTRRFWRGDTGQLGAMATRFAGSSDLFQKPGAKPSRSVNFITAHDGFSLADLVSYGHKYNAANGEENRDGTNDNISWSNGAEGASDDLRIIAARQRDAHALLATLLLSRGAPMLSMGDELGRSQGGNNNAYAQNNALSWLDWSGGDADLAAFVSELARLRAAHPALRDDRFLSGAAQAGASAPDIQWLAASGRPMTTMDWDNANNRCLIAALCSPQPGGAGEPAADDYIVVALNAGAGDVDFALPPAGAGRSWRLALSSAAPKASLAASQSSQSGRVEARSVVVFAAG